MAEENNAWTSSSEDATSQARKPILPQRTTKETHPDLPPGLILGADGKPCKVCNSWQDWAKLKVKKKDAGLAQGSSSSSSSSSAGGMSAFAAMMGGTGAKRQRTTSASDPAVDVSSSSDAGLAQEAVPENAAIAAANSPPPLGGSGLGLPAGASSDRSDCPPDTAALGRSTWTFLHTAAAYYPTTAPPSTQVLMRNLLGSVSILYPCVPCADDFQDDVRANPPDAHLTGREAFSRWLCERHNVINEKLGKPRFSCDWSSLNRRWKDGPEDGSCD